MRQIHASANGIAGGSASPARRIRLAFTLVEMLVATVLTLLLVLALSQAIQVVSTTVAANRVTLEMASRVRGVALRWQQDVQGCTVPVRPWPQQGSNYGYLEYFEGPASDLDADHDGTPDAVQPGADTSMGDVDDYLALTVRSPDGVFFVGRVWGALQPLTNGTTRVATGAGVHDRWSTIQSRDAEVIWWLQLQPDGTRTLHRRVLLVRPDLRFFGVVHTLSHQQFFNMNDVSARYERAHWEANSLADLSRRENRYGHNRASGFPFRLDPSLVLPLADLVWAGGGVTVYSNRLGEDVMLANVKAFDLRVFDPLAVIQRENVSGDAVSPGDPGFSASGTPIGLGAYVDLAYGWKLNLPTAFGSSFFAPPHFRSGLTQMSGSAVTAAYPTYDTWTFDYEHDGLDQDGDGESGSPVFMGMKQANGMDNNGNGLVDENIDEGTNGLDDDGVNGVDDVGERETSPPYPVALRGLQVRIRVIEPSSRQVRQETITASFVPE